MTVASEVKQTLASLKGVRVTLETFASIEQKDQVKEKWQKNITRIDSAIEQLENRVKTLEFEEPQYKGF